MVKILVKKVFEIELNCVLVYSLLKLINQRLNVMTGSHLILIIADEMGSKDYGS